MDQFEWTWTVCEHLGAGLQAGKNTFCSFWGVVSPWFPHDFFGLRWPSRLAKPRASKRFRPKCRGGGGPNSLLGSASQCFGISALKGEGLASDLGLEILSPSETCSILAAFTRQATERTMSIDEKMT